MSALTSVITVALRALSTVAPPLAGKIAFYLFSHPLSRAEVRPSEREVHDSAETATIDVDGNSIVVYRWGESDRTVLLVHGWGSRGSRFAEFVRRLLERGLSVVTFDAPGHGASSGSSTHILHYEAIIHRLHEDDGPFHAVVAHSFASLGVFKSLRGDVQTGRVVSINGVCDFDYLLDAFVDRLRLTERVRRDLRERSEELLASGSDLWKRFSASHEPGSIEVPILIVQDEDDDTVHPEQGRRLADAFGSRATLKTTSSLGHSRILRADTVVATVVDFLVSDQVA